MEAANLYSSTDWSTFGPVLKVIALGECGGTLTMQTRKQADGTNETHPFTYQVSKRSETQRSAE